MGEQALGDLYPIVRAVWPDVDLSNITTERISHRRNADHWRIGNGADSAVVRSTARPASAQRIIAALTALQDEPFAPALRARLRRDDSVFLIAMEDLGDVAPTASDVKANLPAFVETLKRVHSHVELAKAVESVGRGEDEDSSLAWAEEEWSALQRLAPTDERLVPARVWIDVVRENVRRAEDARQIMVHGHGDAHCANWRMTGRGLALIDWEEVRWWPLASELADFIVFGQLDPLEVARLYGAPDSYVPCVKRAAAACGLSFYLYWLRTLLDGSDARAASFEGVREVCERLFAD